MFYSFLATYISESSPDSQTRCHLSSANIWIIKFYKQEVQLRLDFAYRAQGRVMWFPTASLVHFCWNQAHPVRTLLGAAGRHSLFWSSQRFCHHFAGRNGVCGWAVQLAAMAHAEGKTPRGLPQQPAPRGVSLPRKEPTAMASRQLACVTCNAHIKKYSSCTLNTPCL